MNTWLAGYIILFKKGGSYLSRVKRQDLEGIVSHHMVQGINREFIFQNRIDKSKYLTLMRKYYEKFQIDVIAYCIMDNHAHLLLYVAKIENLSRFMQQINMEYARYYNKKKKRVGYVFRNRFTSKPIMTQKQIYACIKYIHMNPVKAGIVKEEKEYEFSSYHEYLTQTGFIYSKLLKFIFHSESNYLEKFHQIKYEEILLENKPVDLKQVLTRFLSKQKVTLEILKKDKVLLRKFIQYLNSNQYQFSKIELAKVLKMGRATLYRRLYETKERNG